MNATLFLILLLRIASYFSIGESAESVQSLKMGLRIATTALSALLLLYALRPKGRTGPAFRVAGADAAVLYAAFLFLGYTSLGYSSAPDESGRQLLLYVESFLFAFAFSLAVVALRMQSVLPLLIFRVVLCVAAVFLAGAYLDPDRFYRLTHGGTVARLGGLIMNPNELGLLLVVGIGMGVLHYWRSARAGRRSPWLLTLPVLLAALVMTASRSSLLALGAVGLYLLLGGGVPARLRALVLAVAAGVALTASGVFLDRGGMEELTSLTGRLPFWRDLLSLALPERPLLGFGFQRIWTDSRFVSPTSYAGEMAHNTFLQLLLGLGVVGLALGLLQLVATLRAVGRTPDLWTRRAAVCLLIPLLLNSLTEFGIFGPMNYGVTLYQIVLFMAVIRPARGPAHPPAPAAAPVARPAPRWAALGHRPLPAPR